MKRHGYDYSRRRRNSNSLDDSEVEDSHNDHANRQRKSLLTRPSSDCSRNFHDNDRGFRHFNSRGVRGSHRHFQYNRGANIVSKYPAKRQRFGDNPGSSRSSSNLQGPLGRIDPMLAAAAAAAVMNAGLLPPNANTAELAQLAAGSSNASQSSNTATSTVAAVAAAAMNAAAMAAAWGSGSLSSEQLSRLTKSFGGVSGGQSSPYRSHASSNRNDRVRDVSPIRSALDDNGASRSFSSSVKYDCDSARFRHHLDHRKPEDDHSATRTLFVGNLMPEITEADLRSLFEKFGLIEDIDIKCRDPESGVNAYAFVRFVNLDMAHRAKTEMSGQLIGQFACKIGYGKVVPTRCLWVGGLGPWLTYPEFATLVEEFGPTEKIIWPSGKNYANILFPNIEMAIRAADALRGYPLGGESRRIRIDFTSEEHMNRDYAKRRRLATAQNQGHRETDYRNNRDDDRSMMSNHRRHKRDYTTNSPVRSNHPPRASIDSSRRYQHSSRGRSPKRRRRKSSPLGNNSPPATKSQRSPEPLESGTRSGRTNSKHLNLQTAVSVDELASCIPVAWEGAFFLKSSSFPCRMHILRGDQSLVDQFMSSISSLDGKKANASDLDVGMCLRITQRMKLDPVKLDDVSQRINTAGNSGFCVLLAVASNSPNHHPGSDMNDSSKQLRPLRNLISYLRTKDSAGVVLLSPGNLHSPSSLTSDGHPVTGVLHAFPPCDFAFDLLKDQAISLPRDYTKDDHLVILLIRSTGSL